MFFGRGKNFIQSDLTSSDIYKDYLSTIDKKSSYNVSKHDYMQICGMFNDLLLKRCVDDRMTVSIPSGIGKLKINSNTIDYNKSKPVIDWKRSVEKHKRVYIFNEFTDGKIFRLDWVKPIKRKHILYYSFKASRGMKRRMADNIKNKLYKYG
jgi:hypothetical protein